MADAAFVALSVLTIGSAIAALELRSLVYGSIALMGTLGGIAGFFLLLDSPFVALFQIAVYVGSIAVLILFTVMLVRRQLIFTKVEDVRRRYAGIGLMLVVMMSLGAVVLDSGLKQVWTDSGPVEFHDVGEDLLTYYWPALVLMGLILASSVTGALVLARREDEYDGDGDDSGGLAVAAAAPAASAAGAGGGAGGAAGATTLGGDAAPAPDADADAPAPKTDGAGADADAPAPKADGAGADAPAPKTDGAGADAPAPKTDGADGGSGRSGGGGGDSNNPNNKPDNPNNKPDNPNNNPNNSGGGRAGGGA